ncbi:MAG: malto-oligosyltrehalose synthase [Bacillota bacterium]|nr:malto-oligosyltrehalose synthase [Bacillota bacterium]
MGGARIPAATYRLQFNEGFRFRDAAALVPYLAALGITDLYASPLLQARRGSPHGYDVTDPTRVNEALGGGEGFALLADELQRHRMGLLLDIVPNHMAASGENPWWRDVLRNGPDSSYADFFDIDWRPLRPGLHGKVLLPVLGAPYGRVLESGEVKLVLAEDGLWAAYREHRMPLSPASFRRLAAGWAAGLRDALGPGHTAGAAMMEIVNRPCGDAAKSLWRLYATSPEIKAFLDENLRLPADDLDRLLAEQSYRLAYWRAGSEELNYRRFFDVTDLAGVRMDDEKVFEATHALVFELVRRGTVTGLRIDHIDGLSDPRAYLRALQGRLARPDGDHSFYIVVEKILGQGEELPGDWPVHGTTGYDFLNLVNAIFVDGDGAAELDALYARFAGVRTGFDRLVYEQKKRVMDLLFPGEVRALAWRLGLPAEGDRHGRDLTLWELERALVEVTACLPVYRTYIDGFTVAEHDRDYIEHAVEEAVRRNPAVTRAAGFLRRVLLLRFPPGLTAEQRRLWLDFVMRWQQFTGPAMAKGFEDTALYIYNRLVSLNEVGGEPASRGIPVREFHRRNAARGRRWPHALNATSTHDTKRSEDVRARINVLSEIAGNWAARVERWSRWNSARKPVVDGAPVPDGNMELLVYQTLIGAWPLREGEVPAVKERFLNYLVKAAREAKVHTGWLDPDDGYEKALQAFASSILEPDSGNRFLDDFREFQRVTAFYGALNSLAQVLLKAASPGVPDFYQGTELWNLSLVDPDNRRPVDFGLRARLLASLMEEEALGRRALVEKLLSGWDDGRVKLYVTYKALAFRRAHAALFAEGEYIPLDAAGPAGEHVCAFARRHGDGWALVAVPRLAARLRLRGVPGSGGLPETAFPLGEAAWGDTALLLPEGAPGRWHNIFTGEKVAGECLRVADLLRHFPVALLGKDK